MKTVNDFFKNMIQSVLFCVNTSSKFRLGSLVMALCILLHTSGNITYEITHGSILFKRVSTVNFSHLKKIASNLELCI